MPVDELHSHTPAGTGTTAGEAAGSPAGTTTGEEGGSAGASTPEEGGPVDNSISLLVKVCVLFSSPSTWILVKSARTTLRGLSTSLQTLVCGVFVQVHFVLPLVYEVSLRTFEVRRHAFLYKSTWIRQSLQTCFFVQVYVDWTKFADMFFCTSLRGFKKYADELRKVRRQTSKSTQSTPKQTWTCLRRLTKIPAY